MSAPLLIDGSRGEGGGQIIRTSLALSCLTGRPIEITNIRAGRAKPGLARQHLTAVRAARTICGGAVTGDEIGSQHLIFAPGPLETREFHFPVGTAGSATLVAQTILPALMSAAQPSTVVFEGGTHNKAAPPWDYLDRIWLPLIESMGPRFERTLHSHGFYPAGGGRFEITVHPSETLRGLELVETGGKPTGQVTALVSRLPEDIGERECQWIRHKAGWKSRQTSVRTVTDSPGPGNVVMIQIRYPEAVELFSGFGERGLPAEKVAALAWNEARAFLADEVPVGPHLCDQLLLPAALAALQGQTSRWVTGVLTEHSLTQIETLKLFFELVIDIEELNRRQRRVTVRSK